MKKNLVILWLCLLSFLVSGFSVHAKDSEGMDLAKDAKSAYLMEYTTGKVIYAKNEDMKLYPASMTKMMGLLLIYEALESKRLSMDDMIITSELAASMGGSQVFLEVNETMSVKDMIKAVCIASANDAMVALGEKIGGTNDHFVKMMNEKAKALHLKNTHFMNATGLHDPDHYSSAKDMALIAKALLEVGKSDLLKITSTYDAYIRENSEKKFWLVNTNKLLKQYDGVDGLKTGFTQEAMSCITVSAKRNNLRLISVIMAAPDSKRRNAQTKQLLDYGFSMFSQGIVIPKDQVVKSYEVLNGLPKKVKLKAKEDIIVIYEKGKEPKEKQRNITITKQNPPYKAQEVIGKLTIEFDDGYLASGKLYVDQAVKPLSYFDIFKQVYQQILY